MKSAVKKGMRGREGGREGGRAMGMMDGVELLCITIVLVWMWW